MANIDKLIKAIKGMNVRQEAKPKASRDKPAPKADADELEKRRLMRQIEEWRSGGF